MENVQHNSDIDDVRHLLLRTGFAESVHTVLDLRTQGVFDILQARIESSAPISSVPAPEWAEQPIALRPDFKSLPPAESLRVRQKMSKQRKEEVHELRQWWLSSLINTANPLAARMTLFWQNHFTSQQSKVRHAPLMYRQQLTLMEHAMGNFGELLGAMLQDPALLIYLDNNISRKQKPNENLARELLELFTLGEGHYKESDVKELARSLTGLSIDSSYNFQFKARHHDDSQKSLLGTTGQLGLQEVVEILLQQDALAEFIVSKLYRYFISPVVSEDAIKDFAAVYRENGHEMKPLLRAMLGSPYFLDPANRGQLVKSPIEFIVGTHRVLGSTPIDDKSILRASDSMQQILYEPPNVSGWSGGTRWINSHTLLARRRFINSMLRGDQINLSQLQNGIDDDTVSKCLLAVDHPYPEDLSEPSAIVRALHSPVYNLC